MKNLICAAGVLVFALLAGFTQGDEMKGAAMFKQDVEFLKAHVDVIILSDESGKAKVAVIPAYQARIATSTADGNDGLSFGWINRKLIASGKLQPHMNPFGGEDRFWMGPEGGQYAIFFAPGADFTFNNWQTPAVIDTEPFDVVSKSPDRIVFAKHAQLTNYADTKFDIQISRTISLLPRRKAVALLGVDVPESVKMVAFQSDNSITNLGAPWNKQAGLLSIWILGMYNPSPQTTVVIPFKSGPEIEFGPKVNDAYFGKVPADRLAVKDDVLFFRADGEKRGKIGINAKRAKPVCGSYDAANKVLTIVQYTLPEGATDYVNSMWEHQAKPYTGDVVNSYNDGPTEDGTILGPFYELETSSPAVELETGKSVSHVHRTFHLQGDEKTLDTIATAVLSVGIDQVKDALK
jgi:hypothetical protein